MGGQWKGGGLTGKSNAEMRVTCHTVGTGPRETRVSLETQVCATCWVPATPRLCLQWRCEEVRCEEVRGETLVVIWALVEAAGLVLCSPFAVGGKRALSTVLPQQVMLGRLVRMVEEGGQGGALACCPQEEGSVQLLWRLV